VTVLGAIAVLLACGADGPATGPPPGQLLLYVDTDAPLTSPDPGALPALFDRVRFDLLPPGATEACAGCSQDFEMQAAVVASAGASVGITYPPGQTGWTARVRLYWSPFASTNGEPDPRSTVDVTVALPAIGAEGVVERTVLLSTDEVGAGPASGPVHPQPGAPSPSAVGTWAGAQRVACTGSARAGEVCVPGGAFWMGTTHSPYASGTSWTGFQPVLPRLVVSSPFYLADREITVTAFRAFASTGPIPYDPGDPFAVTCTFIAGSGHEALPVNCITWTDARAYCLARGDDLPTEAQYEYALGGLRQDPFVWGSDPPTCDGTVFGDPFDPEEPNACTPAQSGPLAVPSQGGRTQDRLQLDAGVVYDLAGNLQEWTLDAWQDYEGSCWSGAGISNDPQCPGAPDAYARSVRGGGWLFNGLFLYSVSRGWATAGETSYNVVGFRCARTAAP